LVVSPATPYTPQGFIDRFLVTAEAYHIPVIILINKKDIDKKKANSHRETLLNLYSKIGYKTLNVSFFEQEDIDQIKTEISNKTVLISGNSGVGKSTLINQLDPSLNQKIGKISKSYNKGQHTTTFAQMFVLNNNIRIIDTPGIKDFGIVNMDKNQVSHFFPEMRDLLHQCKFSNCLHVNEPKCAVIEVLQVQKIRSLHLGSLDC